MRCLLTAGMVLLLTIACGCDALQRDDSNGKNVTVVLGSLYDAAGQVDLNGCSTSIQSVVLTVNGREFSQDVADNVVIFEVRDLPRGVLQASAVVLSNTGDTLYVGEDRRTADSDDFGTVTIQLEKIRPVLQVCPDTLTLLAENDFTGTATIENRDARPTGTFADTLRWRAVGPGLCDLESCGFVEPSSGVTVVPRPELIFITRGFFSTEESFEILLESPFGRTQLYVRLDTTFGR